MNMYIHQKALWPKFSCDNNVIIQPLASIRNKQGRLIGKMETLGFSLREEAVLQTLTLDVLKSNEIEGEILDPEQVRSSIARKLGMDASGLSTADRNVEGVVEMLMDATSNFSKELTEERLFGWHSALFPTGRSGMFKITTGNWRDGSSGPIQVVSGVLGKEKVHFEAPVSDKIPSEMHQFIAWFNNDKSNDPVIKAAIAHLWFVTIHPFADGNGRIARTIADMQLARSDKTSQRFYSMSAQIRVERNKYYDILEKTQKGELDITEWLVWFLACLDRAISVSDEILESVLRKSQYWNMFSGKNINRRQRIMLNKLLDGLTGKLNTSKWAKITKSSQDTALRDIQNLVDQNILVKEDSGGRSTTYRLTELPPAQSPLLTI
ncbi:Fic family protein [Dyadobacter helix]